MPARLTFLFNPRLDNWGAKAIRRKTTGTGSTSHLRKVYKRVNVLRKSNQIWTDKVQVLKQAAVKKIFA
jgi:hypothetical protein